MAAGDKLFVGGCHHKTFKQKPVNRLYRQHFPAGVFGKRLSCSTPFTTLEDVLHRRPSHADATYDAKYGIRAVAGGGRSSARETIGRVAAGAIAKKLLKQLGNTEARL